MNGHGHGYRGRPRGADLLPQGEDTPWDALQDYYRNERLEEPYPEPYIFDRPEVVREHGQSPMQPAEVPRFREGQRENPEWDALRWGDADVLPPVNSGVLAVIGAPIALTTKQLVRAHVPRPVVWMIQPNIDSLDVPVGEAAPILVTYLLTLGCGQSRTTLVIPVRLAPPYLIPLIGAVNVPAQDVQVIATLGYTPTAAGAFNFALAAMAAPWAHMPFGEASERFSTSSLQRRR